MKADPEPVEILTGIIRRLLKTLKIKPEPSEDMAGIKEFRETPAEPEKYINGCDVHKKLRTVQSTNPNDEEI